MSVEQSQGTMDRYFDLMGRGADFSECYSAAATWLVADTGDIVEGAAPVRDFVLALHATMVDARTSKYTVGGGFAYLEGDCAAEESGIRTRYCVAYDLAGDVITAMRCYGLGARRIP